MERMAGVHEHLDGDLDAADLAGNLRDLERINRRLGGGAMSRRAIETLIDGRGGSRTASAASYSLLDVGTGSADIPAALLNEARARFTVTATDVRPEIVAAAQARHGSIPGLTLGVAEGTALPWPDDAFDVAHASLLLHHLEPDAAAALLRELRRVARLGVVINDLDRSRLAWLGAWLLLHATTRNRYTLHDGPLSVRRAYRPDEVRAMAARAGLREVGRVHGFAHHRYALAFRPSPEEPG